MGATESSEISDHIQDPFSPTTFPFIYDGLSNTLSAAEITEDQLSFVPGPKGGRKELGKGGMGVVYLAHWNGHPVAVKKIIEALVGVDSPDSARYRDEFLEEMQMLSQLHHPHILRLLGGSLTDNILVTEFASRGDLFSLIQAKNPAIQWHKRGKFMARDISHAVSAMHSKRIIHRDLKSPNILVCSDFEVKVADVGIAKRLDHGADRLKLTEDQRQYSLLWAAPEMLESDEIDEKADVYSLGVIIWELLTQRSPWMHVTGPFLVSECIKRGEHNPIPADAPEVVRDILERCWNRDPTERPSAAEVALVLSTYCSMKNEHPAQAEEPNFSDVSKLVDEILRDGREILQNHSRYNHFDTCQFISQIIAMIHDTLRVNGFHPDRQQAEAICAFLWDSADAFQMRGRMDLSLHIALHGIDVAKQYSLVEIEAKFLLLHGRLLNESVPDRHHKMHSFRKRDRLPFETLLVSTERMQDALQKFESTSASPEIIQGVENSIDASEALFLHDIVGGWLLTQCRDSDRDHAPVLESVRFVCSALLATDRADLAWNLIYDVLEIFSMDQRVSKTLSLLPSIATTLSTICHRRLPAQEAKWRSLRRELSEIRLSISKIIQDEPLKFFPEQINQAFLRRSTDCIALVGAPEAQFCMFIFGGLGRGFWFPGEPLAMGIVFKDNDISESIWNNDVSPDSPQLEQFRALFGLFEILLRTASDPLRPTLNDQLWFRTQQRIRGTPQAIAAAVGDKSLINESILWDLSGSKVYLAGNDDQILFDQLQDALFQHLMVSAAPQTSEEAAVDSSTPEALPEVVERALTLRHIVRCMQLFDQYYAPSAGDDFEEKKLADASPIVRIYKRVLIPLEMAIDCITRFNYIQARSPWAALVTLGTKLGIIEARFGLVCEWSLSTASKICLLRQLNPSVANECFNLSEHESSDLFRVEWGALRPLFRGLELTLLEKDYPEDPILKDLASVIESWEKGIYKNKASIDWACHAIQSFIETRAWSCDSPRRYRELYIKLPELLRAQMLAFIHSIPPRLQPANLSHVIAALESVPLDDGMRPSTRSSEQSWLKSVNTLLTIPQMDSQFRALVRTDPLISVQVMLEEIDAKVFDLKGELIGTAERGRHAVHGVLHGGVFVHLKAYPEWPGMEYAVGRLSELIIGRGGAPHSRVWAARSAFEPRARWYPIGVSETIHGPTLQEVLRYDQFIPNLDRRSFSQQAIMAMLVNPEDGKSDNFVLTARTDENGKVLSQLVSIDNDHAFVPPVARKMLRPSVQVKTIVFCFQEMLLPIHHDVVEEFLLLKPEKVLRVWLRDLQRFNQDMEALFSPEERQQCLNDPDEAKRSCLTALLRPDTVPHLFQKLRRMHDILKANPKISHIDLLKNVEPTLAPFYLDVLRLRVPPAERFRQLAEREYGGTMVAGAGITKTTTTRTLESVLGALPTVEEIHQPAKFGIDAALSELDEIDRKYASIDTVRVAITQKGDCKPLRALPFEEMKQAALEGLNVAEMSLENQRLLFKGLAGAELTSLVVPGSVAASTTFLSPIFESSKRLTVLDLSNCPSISNSTIEAASKYCPQLAKLFLRDCKTLTAIVMSSLIGRNALDFWNLRRLYLDGCENLQEILIVAPALMELSCKGCTKLRVSDLFGVVRHSDITRLVGPEGFTVRMTTLQVKLFQDRPDRPGILKIVPVPGVNSVICAHSNGTLTWIDVRTGHQLRERDLGRPIRDCSLSGNFLFVSSGQKFAAASLKASSAAPTPFEPAPIDAIEIFTGEIERTINAYATHISCESSFFACAVSPFGLHLRDSMSGQILQRINIFGEAESETSSTELNSTVAEINSLLLHGEKVFVAVPRRVQQLLSSSGKSYLIKAWSFIEEEVVEELVPENSELPIVRMQPLGSDGNSFVSTASDGSLSLWERTPGRISKTAEYKLRIAPLETFRKNSLMNISEDSANFGHCFTMLGERVIMGSADDGIIRAWSSRASLRNGDAPEFVLVGHSAPVTAVATYGESQIISATADGAIRLWRITPPEAPKDSKKRGNRRVRASREEI